MYKRRCFSWKYGCQYASYSICACAKGCTGNRFYAKGTRRTCPYRRSKGDRNPRSGEAGFWRCGNDPGGRSTGVLAVRCDTAGCGHGIKTELLYYACAGAYACNGCQKYQLEILAYANSNAEADNEIETET